MSVIINTPNTILGHLIIIYLIIPVKVEKYCMKFKFILLFLQCLTYWISVLFRHPSRSAALDLRRQTARRWPHLVWLQYSEGIHPALGSPSPRRKLIQLIAHIWVHTEVFHVALKSKFYNMEVSLNTSVFRCLFTWNKNVIWRKKMICLIKTNW